MLRTFFEKFFGRFGAGCLIAGLIVMASQPLGARWASIVAVGVALAVGILDEITNVTPSVWQRILDVIAVTLGGCWAVVLFFTVWA